MSFNISARGIGQIGRDKKFFQYDMPDCIDGDEFEAIQIIHDASKIKPSLDGLKDAAKDEIKNRIKDKLFPTPSIIEMAEKLGETVLVEALKTQVTLLAMHDIYSRNTQAYIFLTARESRILADGYENVRYVFNRHEPGLQFIKTVAPALEETNLNNYGVLVQLIRVLVNYDEMISRDQTPQIMIEIWK